MTRPTTAQRRAIVNAIKDGEGVVFPSTVHPRTLRALKAAGYVTSPASVDIDGYPTVTAKGARAVGEHEVADHIEAEQKAAEMARAWAEIVERTTNVRIGSSEFHYRWSAEENADDTVAEAYSPEWIEIAVVSYYSLKDSGMYDDCDADEAPADEQALVCNAEATDEAPADGVENLVAPKAKTRFATREEWLVEAVEALRPLFASSAKVDIPTVRVSVGWPGGRGKKNTVIGQCWASRAAADKVAQVFISPVLDDAPTVLATLVHELVHAVDDCQSGHKGNFAKIAKAVGLTGKMTATVAGDELKETLAEIADYLEAYPHAKLAAPTRDGQGEKKQTTRMIKVECAACGYTARTTRKWLEEVGAPICPCNKEEMTVAA